MGGDSGAGQSLVKVMWMEISFSFEIKVFSLTGERSSGKALAVDRRFFSADPCMVMFLSCPAPSQMAFYLFIYFYFFFFSFTFISWRLITSQHFHGFCRTLTWISHGVTCIPHPDPPSHLPLHPIPLGLPSAPGPSTCLMHPTWGDDLFHYR